MKIFQMPENLSGRKLVIKNGDDREMMFQDRV